jgi:hypothetical protein
MLFWGDGLLFSTEARHSFRLRGLNFSSVYRRSQTPFGSIPLWILNCYVIITGSGLRIIITSKAKLIVLRKERDVSGGKAKSNGL